MDRTRKFLIAVMAAVLAFGAAPARAQREAPSCVAPSALIRLDQAITHTAARLADGRSLRIVALGSSSTAGIGASKPSNSYPSRVEAELRARYPEMDIVVLNRGIGGEDARDMLARLDKDVIA